MDKQQRGLLLVEKEEAEGNIKRLREQLQATGHVFLQLANNLINDPARIIFTNAPGTLGEFTTEYMRGPSVDWNQFPTKEETAQNIQDLRRELKRLSDLNARLRQ